MNPLDVPTFTMMFSPREMAALSSSVKMVLEFINPEIVRGILGDQTDESLAALGRVDARLERMLDARKAPRGG